MVEGHKEKNTIRNVQIGKPETPEPHFKEGAKKHVVPAVVLVKHVSRCHKPTCVPLALLVKRVTAVFAKVHHATSDPQSSFASIGHWKN